LSDGNIIVQKEMIVSDEASEFTFHALDEKNILPIGVCSEMINSIESKLGLIDKTVG